MHFYEDADATLLYCLLGKQKHTPLQRDLVFSGRFYQNTFNSNLYPHKQLPQLCCRCGRMHYIVNLETEAYSNQWDSTLQLSHLSLKWHY